MGTAHDVRAARIVWCMLAHNPEIENIVTSIYRSDRGGASASVERLLGLCRPAADRIARLYLHQEDAVADVVDDILVRIAQQLPTLRSSYAFPSWFATVAQNTCLQEVRRRRPSPEAQSLEGLQDLEGGLRLVLSDASALQEFEQVESRDLVRQILKTLPGRERDAIVLFYVGGLSQRQIGRHLGVTERGAEGLLYRGLHRAQQIVAQCDGKEHGLITWCPVCGRHQLIARMHLGESPPRPLEIRVACPGCTAGNFSFMRLPLPLDQYVSMDAAMMSGQAILGATIEQLVHAPIPRCNQCGSPMTHERHLHRSDGDALQPGFEFLWLCPRCEYTVRTSLLSVASTVPAWRSFWKASPNLILGKHRVSGSRAPRRIVMTGRDPVAGRSVILTVHYDTLRVRSLEVIER